MLLLKNPFEGAFGLNIGDASVKLARLTVKRHWNNNRYFDIRDLRAIDLPAGCIAGGEILQPELLRDKIKMLLGKQKNSGAIKSPWVVASIPAAKTFLKLIDVDSVPEEVSDEVARFEAAKHLPLDINDVYLDWQAVSAEENGHARTKVLIGAAPKTIVDSYFKVLTDAGLQPLVLEIEELSIARALITAGKSYQNEARAILDLGASRSTVIIYDKGSIQFSSTVNFSGDLIDTALMQQLKIDRDTAEQLKIKNGINYDPAFPMYLKAMTDLADRLIESVYQVLLFYRDHFDNPNPVTHITMSGGLSSMKNLDKMLAEKLETEAAPGHAWKNLLNEKVNKRDDNGLQLTAAIGLSLRAADWLPGR